MTQLSLFTQSEPCLFPMREHFPARVFVTGERSSYDLLRPEFHEEAFYLGVRSLDAVAYLPLGGVRSFDVYATVCSYALVPRG
jgi:hypothetical protein